MPRRIAKRLVSMLGQGTGTPDCDWATVMLFVTLPFMSWLVEIFTEKKPRLCCVTDSHGNELFFVYFVFCFPIHLTIVEMCDCNA